MKFRSPILIGVILTISGLMVISPAIGAPNENAKGGPPELEKYVFIHYYKPSHASDPNCDAACEGKDTNKSFKLVFGGLKWPSLPIDYKINTNQFTGSEQTAIINSAETWDEVLGSTTDLFVDTPGTTTKTQGWAGINDGENIIVKGDLASGTIGVTSFWYNPATNEVVDADMVLNYGDFSWSTNPAGTSGSMDVQNIVTHELGHFLVLDDLYRPPTSALTMYGYSGTGEINARTLGVGDERGDEALYGSSNGGVDDGGPGVKDCTTHPNSPKWCPDP